jgi:hypothetical protein
MDVEGGAGTGPRGWGWGPERGRLAPAPRLQAPQHVPPRLPGARKRAGEGGRGGRSSAADPLPSPSARGTQSRPQPIATAKSARGDRPRSSGPLPPPPQHRSAPRPSAGREAREAQRQRAAQAARGRGTWHGGARPQQAAAGRAAPRFPAPRPLPRRHRRCAAAGPWPGAARSSHAQGPAQPHFCDEAARRVRVEPARAGVSDDRHRRRRWRRGGAAGKARRRTPAGPRPACARVPHAQQHRGGRGGAGAGAALPGQQPDCRLRAAGRPLPAAARRRSLHLRRGRRRGRRRCGQQQRLEQQRGQQQGCRRRATRGSQRQRPVAARQPLRPPAGRQRRREQQQQQYQQQRRRARTAGPQGARQGLPARRGAAF